MPFNTIWLRIVMSLDLWWPTRVLRHARVPTIFFENVMIHTMWMVLVMAYCQGVPRLKKGWPPLV